jgi:hypothetical protein
VNIKSLAAANATSLTFVSANSVEVEFSDAVFGADLDTLDASGVAGTFTLNVTADSDFSDVTLSGIDAITVAAGVELTLNADQAMELGSVISNDAGTGTLHVNGFSTQALDLHAIDIANIGTVTTADIDGTIVVDAAVNFGGADKIVINAETSDTTLQMTADQYHTFCTALTSDEESISACTTTDFSATLRLTGSAADEVLDLTIVDAVDGAAGAADDAVDVTVVLDGITATEDMIIADGTVTLEVSGTNDITMLNTPATIAANAAATAAATIVDVNFTADATLTLTAAQIVAIEAAYMAANPGATDSAFSAAAGANVTINVVDLSTQALDLDLIQDAGITIGTVSIENTDAAITINPATTFGGAAEIITPTADTTAPEYGVESTSVTMTIAQLESSAGVITGDSVINLTGLANNTDTDGDYRFDTCNIDLSNIANAGTVEFTDQVTAETVTLSDTADLGGFEVVLYNGDMIQFATEAQAARTVTENAGTTAIAWLWDTFTAEVDTSNYDSDINTLYINEDLVDSVVVEENLWNTLAGTIVVEKTNVAGIPDVLVTHDRTNTFQALTAIAGVNYDDQEEFASVEDLTINLEGNTNIGNVTVGDTVGTGAFATLTINSYEDRSTITDDNGFTFQPNIIGNISLNAGSTDDLVDVTINTYERDDNANGMGDEAGYNDPINVNGAAAEREGLAIEVGTITFASSDTDVTEATLTLTGAEDITIAGVELGTNITKLTVDASGVNYALADVSIAALNTDDAGDAIVADADFIYVLEGHTAVATEDFNATVAVENILIEVRGGVVDLTEAAAFTDVDALHVSADATLTLTAAQVLAIGEINFSVDAGVAVTVNVTELGNAAIDLNVLQDA